MQEMKVSERLFKYGIGMEHDFSWDYKEKTEEENIMGLDISTARAYSTNEAFI